MVEKQEQTILTEEGYQNLVEELEYLKTTRRAQVGEELRVARGFGDFSENAELDIAKAEKKELEERIETIELQLKTAQIIKDDPKEGKNKAIRLGSVVKLLDVEFNEEMEFQLVGTLEANPKKNRISNESPLGQKMLGAKPGDTLLVETQGGNIAYKVLEIVK